MLIRLFLALCSLSLLCGGALPSASAQSGRETAAAPVAFPAAAGIAPAGRPVGPVYVAPVGSATSTPAALIPNDVVVFDSGFTGSTGPKSSTGAIFNLSVHNNGTGAENILASTTVGSGVTFSSTTGSDSIISNDIAVSPAGLIYYLAQRTTNSTVYVDVVELTPSTQVRRVISSGDNTSQGSTLNYSGGICYDFSTGTLLINTPDTNAAKRGIYRVNPATGARTLVSLDSNAPAGVPADGVYYLSTDPFGNIFYTDLEPNDPDPNTNGQPKAIVEVPVTADASGTYGTRRLISSNLSTFSGYNTAPFNYITTAQVDNTQSVTLSGGLPSTTEYLLVTDQGDNTASADLYRVPVNTGAHTQIITAATNTNSTSAPFDLPNSAQIDTTGRIYYEEAHNYSEGNSNNVNTGNVIPAGGRANTVLSGVMNLSKEIGTFRIVPPPTPTLAAGTASNVAGTTATLNSNVTADGGVPNAGIFQSGFVYAPTATNNAPKIGGTGVTQKPVLSLTTLPATQGANLGAISNSLTGLTAGTSYSFSAYARDVSGFTYTAPVTFVTATVPAVTTNAATSITGTSAALNGNVTSSGGASLTARGFVYSSTATTPTISMSGVTTLTDGGTSTGTYSDPATGLPNGTKYYFRAYATSAVGTTYGSVLTFTTAAASPTANNQSVSTAFNTAKAITLTGSDSNTPTQTLTYNVTGSPAHGALSGTAPNLTYTPNTNYTGADSFAFTVSNGQKTSSAATVSLTVIGQPTISSFTPASGPAGTTVTITGTDLQNALGVNFFRNVAGTALTVVSSTQVTVKVPTGASTGTLTMLSGSGSNSSSTKFVVTP